MEQMIKHFCTAYGLGELLADPVSVTGGLMHAMYHVKTVQGEYAIKRLNADIMQRPTAYQNLIHSEIVSNALKDTVPLAAAKCFDGKHIIEHGGCFWIVFDWAEGKSVYPPAITETHCAKVGALLGRIHAANLHMEQMERSPEVRSPFAWEEWLACAQRENSECYALLQENISDIQLWDEQLVSGWPLVQRRQVISHRDLDPKNILWKEEQPLIIDWEAAGYVNPAQELVEALNYWIVDPDGQYNHRQFQAMVNAYAAHMDLSGTDWNAVLSASFAGMLGWLAYNVKRAIGLEGSHADDRTQGMAQVRQTLQELRRYQRQMDILHGWLTSFSS